MENKVLQQHVAEGYMTASLLFKQMGMDNIQGDSRTRAIAKLPKPTKKIGRINIWDAQTSLSIIQAHKQQNEFKINPQYFTSRAYYRDFIHGAEF
jgi:hypothetical protein